MKKGTPNMDLIIREARAVVDGPIAVIRFGTCGTPNTNVKVGTVIVTDYSISCTRQPDYFNHKVGEPYKLSLPVKADPELTGMVSKFHFTPFFFGCINLFFRKLLKQMKESAGSDRVVVGPDVTCCSFFSSQGRQDPFFNDENQNLFEDKVKKAHPNLLSIQMETFHLFEKLYFFLFLIFGT